MGKIDFAKVVERVGNGYPSPFDQAAAARRRLELGAAAGLDQFGVNLLTLPPGTWSSQRHYHSAEDEFVFVVEGEVVLVTDAGEEVLGAGECAGFKAGVADGHHLQNRSAAPARVLELGSRAPESDRCDYPDIDLVAPAGTDVYTRRDGTPYPRRP